MFGTLTTLRGTLMVNVRVLTDVQRSSTPSPTTMLLPTTTQIRHTHTQTPPKHHTGVDAYQRNVDMLGGRTLMGKALFADAGIVLHTIEELAPKRLQTRWTLRIRAKVDRLFLCWGGVWMDEYIYIHIHNPSLSNMFMYIHMYIHTQSIVQ